MKWKTAFNKELLLNGGEMIAIVANDDPEQTQYAANILQNHAIFISKTVILELEWVLRF